MSSTVNASLWAHRLRVSRNSEAKDCSTRESASLKTARYSVRTSSRTAGSRRWRDLADPCVARSRASSMRTQSPSALAAAGVMCVSTKGSSPSASTSNIRPTRSLLLTATVVPSVA